MDTPNWSILSPKGRVATALALLTYAELRELAIMWTTSGDWQVDVERLMSTLSDWAVESLDG